MIDSLRMPIAHGPSTCAPSSSGPRWIVTAPIASSAPRSAGAPSSRRYPWMPHIALSLLRAGRTGALRQPRVDRLVARHTRRPVALGFDEAARVRRDSRPIRPPFERGCDRLCERVGIAGGEQEACFAVAHELAMTADVGGEHDAALRHRLERLQRRDELGEPYRAARIDERV